jgi:hypothetical protein
MSTPARPRTQPPLNRSHQCALPAYALRRSCAPVEPPDSPHRRSCIELNERIERVYTPETRPRRPRRQGAVPPRAAVGVAPTEGQQGALAPVTAQTAARSTRRSVCCAHARWPPACAAPPCSKWSRLVAPGWPCGHTKPAQTPPLAREGPDVEVCAPACCPPLLSVSDTARDAVIRPESRLATTSHPGKHEARTREAS